MLTKKEREDRDAAELLAEKPGREWKRTELEVAAYYKARGSLRGSPPRGALFNRTARSRGGRLRGMR